MSIFSILKVLKLDASPARVVSGSLKTNGTSIIEVTSETPFICLMSVTKFLLDFDWFKDKKFSSCSMAMNTNSLVSILLLNL